MVFPINDPVPIIIEGITRDKIAIYKGKNQFNVRNMDSVINKLIEFYEEHKECQTKQ